MGINGLSVSASEGLTTPCLTCIRNLPMVTHAMPLTVRYSVTDAEGITVSSVICGIDSGADQVISLELLAGRMLTDRDVTEKAQVCVVDEAFADEVFGGTQALGKTVTAILKNKPVDLTVVGISAAGSSLLQTVTAVIPYMLYLPYTTVQSATDKSTFDQIAVRVSESADPTVAEQAITAALTAQERSIGILTTENLTTQRQRLEQVVSLLSLLLTAIGGVTLGVSGFGIMTGMLSAVQERTREIGIKKALGAGRSRILAEFLLSALLIGFFGAAIGMSLGAVILKIGCTAMGLTPVWSAKTAALIAGAVLGVGLLFGVYPAYRAASLPPMDALRTDL